MNPKFQRRVTITHLQKQKGATFLELLFSPLHNFLFLYFFFVFSLWACLLLKTRDNWGITRRIEWLRRETTDESVC